VCVKRRNLILFVVRLRGVVLCRSVHHYNTALCFVSRGSSGDNVKSRQVDSFWNTVGIKEKKCFHCENIFRWGSEAIDNFVLVDWTFWVVKLKWAVIGRLVSVRKGIQIGGIFRFVRYILHFNFVSICNTVVSQTVIRGRGVVSAVLFTLTNMKIVLIRFIVSHNNTLLCALWVLHGANRFLTQNSRSHIYRGN
jgi:hypothetical protein